MVRRNERRVSVSLQRVEETRDRDLELATESWNAADGEEESLVWHGSLRILNFTLGVLQE